MITKLILAFLLGFVAAVFSMMIHFWDRGYSFRDVSKAYDQGYNEALKINPPGDRLETACAALWFTKNTKIEVD